jgi:hypothetical protein
MASELVWIWAPSIVFAAAALWIRRRELTAGAVRG